MKYFFVLYENVIWLLSEMVLQSCSDKRVRNINWIMCSHGQVVKTLASHAGIRGSTPLGSTKKTTSFGVSLFYQEFKQGESNPKGTEGLMDLQWSQPRPDGQDRWIAEQDTNSPWEYQLQGLQALKTLKFQRLQPFFWLSYIVPVSSTKYRLNFCVSG